MQVGHTRTLAFTRRVIWPLRYIQSAHSPPGFFVLMLTIRKEQMLALSASMVRSFEEQMVVHLAASFPQQFEQLKEAGVQKLVRMGIDKGALYGVNSVRDVTTLV